MSAARDTSVAAYARKVERLWAALVRRPVVLSPRDWARISAWHERGIPLQIVREALEEEAARRGDGPRTLARVERAVEETWSVVCRGRLSEAGEAAESSGSARGGDPVDAWRKRVEGDEGSPLASLLEALLARLADGEAASAVDAELDRRLPAAAPRDLARRVERVVARDLEAFRGRMTASRLESTRAAAILGRLRRALQLPRLSIDADER